MRRRDRESVPQTPRHWFKAEEGEVHRHVFDYVSTVERQQFDLFNRFLQLEVLYDPNTPNASAAAVLGDSPGLVIENVVAGCVDTVTAQIATAEVRPRFLVNNAGWTVRCTAKKLEWYTEGLGKLLDIHTHCRQAFKSAAKKGTGCVKVYINQFNEIKVESVRIDDIVVDEAECRNGAKPRQIHRRMPNVDRDELKAMFPDHEEAITRAQTGHTWSNMWAGYRPILDNELVVVESHRLPIGRRGHSGYRPGRHTICIDGHDLLDEEWHKPFFPYVFVTWSEREGGFYGISLTEGIAGIQRALNKRNLQIDRNLDQYAFPTTYVGMADANLAIQAVNRIGSVVPVRGQIPTTVTPQAVSPEVYQNRADLKSAAFENSGVSRMASQAVKPAGIDSGVGMREYRDQTTQRFAPQEKDFEQLELDTYLLALDCCKDLGDDAPVISRKSRFGSGKVKWSDVDMGDVRVQIAASSTLGKTPAGRYQTALEWAQAGVISTDEWRRLIEHPDLDRILSLYTQGMDSIEKDIEAIESGKTVMPEPFGNLQLASRMAQMAFLRDRDYDDPDDPVPEEVLEGLRDYAILAAHMLDMASAQTGGMPMAAQESPPATQPMSAMSPEAAQSVAA